LSRLANEGSTACTKKSGWTLRKKLALAIDSVVAFGDPPLRRIASGLHRGRRRYVVESMVATSGSMRPDAP
jgi:hypothetical protein